MFDNDIHFQYEENRSVSTKPIPTALEKKQHVDRNLFWQHDWKHRSDG